MKIDFTKNNGNLIVTLDGRLDSFSAPDAEKFISEICVDIETLTLDCEKLVYISSAGLRILLTLQKKMNGAVKLINVCELVMEVFEMTGFTDILVIE